MVSHAPTIRSFVFKIASRCNLNCSYCYVYNQGDNTWRSRPKLMSIDVFDCALTRIAKHCSYTNQSKVSINFHGGEPCLVGPDRFDEFCRHALEHLSGLRVRFSIQTNGTLITQEWLKVFRRHRVTIGVSIDGPQEIHDASRVDHLGRGSFSDVVQGVRLLMDAGLSPAALSVIPIGCDPLVVHRSLLNMGFSRINYLFPDLNFDSTESIRTSYGLTPCADFLIPIFEDWWSSPAGDYSVFVFDQIARLILGGKSSLDTLGGGPLSFLFIETDGDIEGLDVLRVCASGAAKTGANVRLCDFDTILAAEGLHRAVLLGEVPLPTACAACPESSTCAGGYLPHRFRPDSGFDNPSYWCADILKLFSHIRSRLGVEPTETGLRRQVLAELQPDI